VIKLKYEFRKDDVVQEITVLLFDVKQVRDAESSAPWDIGVTIMWGEKSLFDRPLSGADPLHAVELAARFASDYLRGRAEDLGGILEPPITAP
jgi:hypothetical protein